MPDINRDPEADILAALSSAGPVPRPDPSRFLAAVARRRWERRVRTAGVGVTALALIAGVSVLLRPPQSPAPGAPSVHIAHAAVRTDDRPTMVMLAIRNRAAPEDALWLGPEFDWASGPPLDRSDR